MRKRFAPLGLAALGLALLAAPPFAAAEQSVDVGKHAIHYNAFTTDMLQPEMARQYDITRSPSRALITVSVLEKVMDTTGRPVPAKVQASATNLNNQLQTIPMREVDDAGAIYYLGTVSVSHEETLRFTVRVRPQGAEQTYTVRFRKQFYTHP